MALRRNFAELNAGPHTRISASYSSKLVQHKDTLAMVGLTLDYAALNPEL